ncbi:MAG: hypothetical protein PHS49_00640 [Candidatus Gracilibacteria bacterium]|nr:hypothetical protein [Candidatus Gracilibacteria bacterium]
MKKYLETYYKGLINGLGIITIIGISGVAYGAYVSISDVAPNDTLTASTFNQVLANISSIKTSVDNAAPVGAVMAFNLSSCPSGWGPANGSNGTPDLRGEFIRGWDNGRGVDAGRAIGTLQRGSLVMNSNSYGDARVFSLLQDNDLGYDPAITNPSNTYGRRDDVATGGGAPGTWGGAGFVDTNYVKMTRPRNVALLYCVKQ